MIDPGTKSAFFYGTLMHPKILRRVVGSDGKHLKICPAILMDYTRHRVRGEDFPGIVDYDRGRRLVKRDLLPEERSVRGTLVIGLTVAEMRRLDAFEDEGDMYVRQVVQVTPLEEATALEAFVDDEGIDKNLIERIMPSQPQPVDDIVGKAGLASVETEAYVFLDERQLEPELWSFAEFLRDKAWQWYDWTMEAGRAKEGNLRPEGTEFDRRIRQSDAADCAVTNSELA